MSLTQSPSYDINALERRFSIEETYALAESARRKSSSEQARNDLRQRVGHAQMLEVLENVIRSSPPPSPRQIGASPSSPKRVSFSDLEQSAKPFTPIEEVDEYGFAYDDGEEDYNGLSLCRTPSRRF